MRISTQAGAALLALAVSLAHAQPAGDAAKPKPKAPRPPTALQHRFGPWLGDFDGMLERRLVRVLVPYSRTLYFNDKGAQRGLTAAAVRDFERFLDQKFKLRGRPITVIAMPTTRDRLLAGPVEGRGDITEAEPNVHAGVRYLRHLYDREVNYAGLDEHNRTLFALAAYNAGPGRVARLRSEARRTGLDPNVWFNRVERVAALRVGQETVGYVRNIYKYYVAYKLQLETLEARKAARRKMKPAAPEKKI